MPKKDEQNMTDLYIYQSLSADLRLNKFLNAMNYFYNNKSNVMKFSVKEDPTAGKLNTEVLHDSEDKRDMGYFKFHDTLLSR